MKIPQTFIPEKDLTRKVDSYLKDTSKSGVALYTNIGLYNHIKNVYEGLEHRNIILLHGPPATGKTLAIKNITTMLSKDYALAHISLSPVGVCSSTKEIERYHSIMLDIEFAVLTGKKVYVDIMEIDKFSNTGQMSIRDILEEYKSGIKVAFIFQSSYTESEESINPGGRDGPKALKDLGEDRMLRLEFKTRYH